MDVLSASRRKAHLPSLGRTRSLFACGVVLILIGLALNEYVLAWLIAGEGSFRPGNVRQAILIVEVLLVALGVSILVLRRREIAVNLMLALVSAVVFGLLGGEVLLRGAIHLGVEKVRDPRLYAGWCDDDDQWKLRYHWLTQTREALGASGFAFHPRYGWITKGTPEGGEHAVLLYGDSFAYGVEPSPVPMRLAGQLDRLLAETPVINYAVSGYGLDQIYLRMRDTHRSWQQPTILFGLMTLDLDCAILTLFINEARKASREVAEFYYPAPNNHPNEEGNRLVAEALAGMLNAK